MTIEAEAQQNEEVIHKESSDQTHENTELAHIAISVKTEAVKSEVVQTEAPLGSHFSDKLQRAGRLTIFLICVAILIIGRFSVPDEEVACVQDKIMEVLAVANTFINTSGNETVRNFLQIFCSLMIDIVFIITFGYWVLRGKSGRLPVTLGVFYITRALVQKVWFSPFPQGFYWNDPGFPSLVVPYGRGSDFFFSGHAGFLVICASEWHRLKFPKIRNFVILTAIYTILILLIYRIHYSIDIFTGVIFAEWCFCKVDGYKDIMDYYWVYCTSKIKDLFTRKTAKLPKPTCEATPLTLQV